MAYVVIAPGIFLDRAWPAMGDRIRTGARSQEAPSVRWPLRG